MLQACQRRGPHSSVLFWKYDLLLRIFDTTVKVITAIFLIQLSISLCSGPKARELAHCFTTETQRIRNRAWFIHSLWLTATQLIIWFAVWSSLCSFVRNFDFICNNVENLGKSSGFHYLIEMYFSIKMSVYIAMTVFPSLCVTPLWGGPLTLLKFSQIEHTSMPPCSPGQIYNSWMLVTGSYWWGHTCWHIKTLYLAKVRSKQTHRHQKHYFTNSYNINSIHFISV